MNTPKPPLVDGQTRAGIAVSGLLALLAEEAPRLFGDGSVRVTGVRQDSRLVEPGDLFVARSGGQASGAEFAQSAVQRGAVALLIDRGTPLPSSLSVPVLEVTNAQRALGPLAQAVYGDPSRALPVIGITGTNGKTTTAWLVERALAGSGEKPARLGTVGFAFNGEHADSALTTPEADDLARYAAHVRDLGGTHLVMEVSSIALTVGRVHGLKFRVAAFSNLTQDHLDFHGSMAEYSEAKALLFTALAPEISVLNVDDPFGEALASRAVGRVLRVSKHAGADVYPLEIAVTAQGIQGRIQTPGQVVELTSRFVGQHNLDNLLLALGVLTALGVDLPRAACALGSAPQVPGRLERCDEAGDDIMVLVDYAHTPDALERVLDTARDLTNRRVLCVFGCGGDRDPQKRPLMGAAVGERADYAIITNDNPRSEAPRAIADAIESALKHTGTAYDVILDRARAIAQIVAFAEPGDVVLIAGKGHEPYQLLGRETHPFDDRVEARRALELRRRRGNT